MGFEGGEDEYAFAVAVEGVEGEFCPEGGVCGDGDGGDAAEPCAGGFRCAGGVLGGEVFCEGEV